MLVSFCTFLALVLSKEKDTFIIVIIELSYVNLYKLDDIWIENCPKDSGKHVCRAAIKILITKSYSSSDSSRYSFFPSQEPGVNGNSDSILILQLLGKTDSGKNIDLSDQFYTSWELSNFGAKYEFESLLDGLSFKNFRDYFKSNHPLIRGTQFDNIPLYFYLADSSRLNSELEGLQIVYQTENTRIIESCNWEPISKPEISNSFKGHDI